MTIWTFRATISPARPPSPGSPGSARPSSRRAPRRSEEHTSELQSQSNLVCRLLLEKKKNNSLDNYIARKDATSDYLHSSKQVADINANFMNTIDAILIGPKSSEVMHTFIQTSSPSA